ncbi:hypothetical protein GGS23DRAFT_600594 [Durotheca rogersii]|uniref:uncharacterized protein n=1 Tax=Durotheca rogersii TaxID=419775 RepID=UPI00221F51CE|nr:uncharacterized protein GGS23DRAFT_600594 [Durotheca rogersii]KAI5859305.1 hypothetical protein GGS23DRAFT_600594 [Durotheca rogersii]
MAAEPTIGTIGRRTRDGQARRPFGLLAAEYAAAMILVAMQYIHDYNITNRL